MWLLWHMAYFAKPADWSSRVKVLIGIFADLKDYQLVGSKWLSYDRITIIASTFFEPGISSFYTLK